MKKNLKKVVLFLMLVVSSLVFGKEKLYVGTNAEFPPFEYLDKGEVVGFDIDLLKSIAQKLDMEVVIKDMAFDGLIPALETNKVDVVISGMTVTDERKLAVNFSNPYYTANQVIVLKDDNNSIKNFDDLNGKLVGVMLGFTGDVLVSEMKDVKNKKYNATYAAIMELQNNKIDAIVLDSETALNYVKNNKGLKLAETKGQPEEYAIAISKKNTELLDKINQALKELKEDGTYQTLLEKYM
ncbi:MULTISPECIES: basic amino acid ABC transporter substrate-binding protein [Cetobacterium]|jgi:polar amino acid transport system substrate-binding protein|uniref:Basic amino acid ABC transporter substrate-binding protein n=1 Tax=Candidatus Cetobacterium colombiensis TaxID=3073100 RepID=A0ABU4W9H3_9FUSO|nr:basic amino acid ABC transporter substrate-binding protein [Candidatus Cetobacterium colombiensis]MDX8335854.1 basic amino acid ABC transporter substrate-binding protein [Candidatus Cetobacterium colombiensis]